jgi:NAD(P)-dependent dehydrogenase (short-subunit alcohol dehydrogenase family)
MKLSNYNAIITGANQGLGLTIAEEFIKEGASISICARDSDKLKSAVEYLKKIASPEQKILSMRADVSVEEDVKSLIDYSINSLGKIDIVVNNAGIYGPKGLLEEVDSAEWKKTFEVNLFGTFYMCKHIIKHMKENNYGKIINVSGGGSGALPTINAYVTSKAGIIKFTETIAKEYEQYNIGINAIAPGALNTRLLDEVLKAGPEVVDKDFYEKSLKQKKDGGVSLQKGADLCVFLASPESDGITGKIISAVWDPWSEFKTHIQDIKNTDIYTFRRIVPKDRNMNWDPN